MQNHKETESTEKLVFATKLETIPGGGTVAVVGLGYSRVMAGAPVRLDTSNGLYKIIKTAKVTEIASNSATSFKVAKGSLFAVGDKIGKDSTYGNTITAIDRNTSTSYDEITVSATFGTALAVGDILEELTITTVENTTTYAGFDPVGYIGTTFDVRTNDNHLQDIVVRGSIIEANLAYPISSRMKGKTPVIRFA